MPLKYITLKSVSDDEQAWTRLISLTCAKYFYGLKYYNKLQNKFYRKTMNIDFFFYSLQYFVKYT